MPEKLAQRRLLAAGSGAVPPLLRRNEVLVPLQDFQLW